MNLTEKQNRFVDFYIETGNATEAVKKAGYRESTARFTGSENLTKPNIKAAIDVRLAEMDAKRKSLEGVLVPITAKWNEELLESAGFSQIDCFWRCLNFAGWIAIK